MRSTIRVLIADDHAIVRAALRAMLQRQTGITVAGEAHDGHETVRLATEARPDVVLLDVHMPGRSGLDALRDLADARHSTRVLLLTAGIERGEIASALALGARGVVLKSASAESLLNAIRTAAAGGLWLEDISPADLGRAPAAARGRAGDAQRAFGLTPREREVVGAVAAGQSNREIARTLDMSEQTVKHHLRSAFDKTGTSTRLELALFAIRHQLASI